MKKNRILLILLVILVAVFAFASCDCAHVYENGVCTECGEADPNYCDHQYEEGVCIKCQGKDPNYAPCKHTWVNGKCTACEEKCSHNWQNGVCSVCAMDCAHVWGNGTCTKCEYDCPHESWEGGACVDCKSACAHTWEDGVCTVCEYACVHSWSKDSVCNVCGDACEHEWLNGVCAECKKECEHTWADGVCTVCAFACAHTWDNGTCTVCKLVCVHQWNDGRCTTCKMYCQHDWNGNVCNVCAYECPHIWENGNCTYCGVVCTHEAYENGICSSCGLGCEHAEYENGACKVCGIVCVHAEYENGACKVCGTVCAHETYEEGACTVCGMACTHEAYENGVCVACGTVCAHETYVEGVCASCGALDPDYVPADGGVSMYAEIVERYKYLVLYKFTVSELPEEEAEPAYYEAALRYVANYYDPSIDLGFAYKDINGDGYVELLLMGKEARLYALFTIVNREAVVVKTFQDGMGYLDSTGLVFSHEKRFEEGTTNQIGLTYRFERLVDGKLVGTGFGWDDGDGVYATEDDEVYFKLENGEKVTIDYDTEYKVLVDHTYEYYIGYPTRVTKLSNLVYNTALVEKDVPTVKADFSSYEAIIKTFTYMYTNVAGNDRLDKSDWFKGDYDNGMIFDTYEDYVTYSKIVAGAGFITSGSSAKYGHAVKDLNGDGVNELILMDSYGSGTSAKFGIFAIFTLVDEKPVLLEFFTDVRFAFIDADSNIVVCDRPIPAESGKKDREFIVYTIENGALKVVEKYGYLCDTTLSGAQNTWYKVVDGERVIIEKAEFTEWFDANVKVAGSSASISNFSKYTAKVSGLEFTEIVTEE